MVRQRHDIHSKHVEAWKRKNSGVSEKDLPRLFINGILAVRRRSLDTLSHVTVTAVIDRILLECQDRFSVLAEIKNDSQGLHFKKFADHLRGTNTKEIQEALQEFLLELLEVFGKITAEILTKNLHQELMTVTDQTPPKDVEQPATISLGIARKNRDQK